MQNDTHDKADIIAIPPLIYAAGLLLGLFIHFIYRIKFLPQTISMWVGILLISVSIPIALSAVRALARAKTTFDVRKSTTAVVTDGTFRFSRNPMYLSLTLLYFGIASLINSLWIAIFVLPVIVVIQLGVIEPEERYLERKFGDEYLRYKSRVRRWI